MRISRALTSRRYKRINEGVNDQAKKVPGEAMALSETEREQLAELLLTSLPRLSKREQADIEKTWVDEAVAQAEALGQGDLVAQDGDTAIAELRTVLSK